MSKHFERIHTGALHTSVGKMTLIKVNFRCKHEVSKRPEHFLGEPNPFADRVSYWWIQQLLAHSMSPTSTVTAKRGHSITPACIFKESIAYMQNVVESSLVHPVNERVVAS